MRNWHQWPRQDKQTQPAIRRIALAFVLLSATLSVASCGYRPLYGELDDKGTSVVNDMAAVQIRPIRNRNGQILHNELLDRLNPQGAPANADYLLEATLREQRIWTAIRKDDTATRANLQMNCDYNLRDAKTGEVILRSRSFAAISFNVQSSEYATIMSENDARRRGAVLIADDIKLRLAAHFNQRRQNTATK